MRLGAQDYIMKGNLSRLCPAIARELEEGEARDITERMQAEELLKQSEAKYRLLADHVTDVIFTMDMNFQYTYLSPSISQLIGYTADELLTMRGD
jgi:PAS domain-containing protein